MAAAGDEVGFLRIDAIFGVAAGGAVEAEAWGGVGGDHRGTAEIAQGAGGGAAGGGAVELEQDVEAVFDPRVFAIAADARGEALWGAEEGHGPVEQMGAEVLQEAVGVVAGLFPGVGPRVGAETVPLGVDGVEPAEGAFGEQVLDREEVAVPAAVVEGKELFAGVAGGADEGGRGGAGGSHGLVNDDVLAGAESGEGERFVGFVGGANDDEIDVRGGEGCLGGAQDAGSGVGFGGFVPAALDDCGEFEAGNGADEGAMEDTAGETKAEDGDADRFTHARPLYGAEGAGFESDAEDQRRTAWL